MGRFEIVLLGASFASYAVGLAGFLGWVRLADAHPLDLYAFFSIAAAGGWLIGNVAVHRRRMLRAPRRLLAVYLLGPPGMLYLLWTMGSAAQQELAPLVPLYGFGVFTVFFLVPVTLRRF